MRQLLSRYIQEILKSTQVVGLILGIGGLVFLGGVCTKKIATNMNVAVNSNIESNSSISNANENTNASEVDTSDWLTYTNEEYGFSFRYPGDWTVRVVGENDEGGMGTSLGEIVLSSDFCTIGGTKLRNGSVDRIKMDLTNKNNLSLEEININGIKGIKYYDVVNENGGQGYIYVYTLGENEFSFSDSNEPQNETCQKVLSKVMMNISSNS